MPTLKRPRSPRANESHSKRVRFRSRVHPTFFDLPSDIRSRIFAALPLGDLHSVRLSGMVTTSTTSTCPSAIAATVSDEFKRKRAEIQTVRSMLPAKGYTKEQQLPPTEFVKVKKLRISRWADTLPRGIGHFAALRELNLSSPEISLDALPDVLGQCRYMSRLYLRENSFAEFPPVILGLKRLTHLDISLCARIADDIPEDIGKCLPNLKAFNIEQCGFQHLPKSLVRTLERNLNKTQKQKYVPLTASPAVFPRGYLRECINKRKYPKLAAKCEHIFLKNDEDQPAPNGAQGGEDGADGDEEAQFEDIDEII